MTYEELYREGVSLLKEAQIAENALDARLLLEMVCKTDRNDLLAHGDRPVTSEQIKEFRDLVSKRATHIPLQHLTGVQNFMGLDFTVNENVLIPRQDTEILVEEVLKEMHDGMRILDLCTGSGCILLSLMHYSNDCEGEGIDLSEEALKVAKENAAKLLPEKMEQEKIKLYKSDLFSEVSGKFDRIVSNPPYISKADCDTLMPEVKDHEPFMALCGGEDGLDFYRKIIDESVEYLWGNGMLYFEIGYDQGKQVSDLMREKGFCEVEVIKDYAGLDRVVFGTWPAC